MNSVSTKTPSLTHIIKRMMAFSSAQNKKRLGILAMMAVITSLLELAAAGTVVFFAQTMQNPTHYFHLMAAYNLPFIKDATTFLIIAAILCAITFITKNIWTAFETFIQQKTVQNMNWQMKRQLLERYSKSDYQYFSARNPAYSMSVVASDVEIVYTNGFSALTILISETIVFAVLISLIIYMNPSLIMALGVCGGGIAYIVLKILMPKFYKWGQRWQNANMKTFQYLNQFFFGFKDILLSGKQEKFIQAFSEEAQTRARAQSLQSAAFVWPRMTLESAFMGLVVFTIILLVWMNQTPQQIMSIMGAYLYAGFRLLPGANRTINALNMLKTSAPAIIRLAEEWNNIPPEGHYTNIPELKFNHAITVSNVSFQYAGSNNRMILDAINLEIRKGEWVGIIGHTGSGKSTLIDLILGLITPTSGTVMIDSTHPATTLQWHHKIGYVAQTPTLMDDTIAANIAFGEPKEKIDLQKINRAINEAQLKELIEKLPEGINTNIGERGTSLSGGERQRITIARALYNQPEILVFDEATSALDAETEARLMNTIAQVARNHTVIMIAHRLSTLKDCTRVIEIQNGKIISTLNKQQLLERSARDEHAA